MKKLQLIISMLVICWLLISPERTKAQSGCVCDSSKVFLPNDISYEPFDSLSLSTVWYKVDALSDTIDIIFKTFGLDTLNMLSKITLYSGTCSGGLTVLASDTISSLSDTVLSLSYTALDSGDVYYVKLQKRSASTSPLYFEASIDYHEIDPFLEAVCFNNNEAEPCDVVCNGAFLNNKPPPYIPDDWRQLSNTNSWGAATMRGPKYFFGISPENHLPVGYVPLNVSYEKGIPYNAFGIQYPYGFDATSFNAQSNINRKGYAGFTAHTHANTANYTIGGHSEVVSYSGPVNSHEYVKQRLKCKLIKDVTYQVSFRVSLGDYCGWATNHIGMYLTMTPPSTVSTTSYIKMVSVTIGGVTYWQPQSTGAGAGQLLDHPGGTPIIPQITQYHYGGTLATDYITGGHNNDNTWILVHGNFTPTATGTYYAIIGDFGDTGIADPSTGNQYSTACANYAPVTPVLNPYYYYSQYTSVPGFNTPLGANGKWAFYYVDNVIVTPNPLVAPAISLISPDVNQCQMLENTDYTYGTGAALNSDFNYSVTVEPADNLVNATPTVNVTTGSFVLNWTTLPTSSVTITLHMSVCNSECSATSTYVVIPCCRNDGICAENLGDGGDNIGTGGHYIIKNVTDVFAYWAAGELCSSWSNIPGQGMTATNTALSINGTFIIDKDLTFDNCDVLLGTEAKIIVVPGYKFNITSSHLHACKEMWNSITVIGGGNAPTQIHSDRSLIEDADSAIVIEKGGFYKIDKSIFNKNYKGLVIHQFSGAMSVSDYYVQSSVFTSRDLGSLGSISPCTGSMAPGSIGATVLCLLSNGYSPSNYPGYPDLFSANSSSSDYQFSVLNEPRHKERGYVGIETRRVTASTGQLELGNQKGEDEINTFDYLDFGIRSLYSNVAVYHNIFINIYDILAVEPGHGPPLVKTCGVWGFGNGHIDPNYYLTVGGHNVTHPYQTNWFYYTQNGVYSDSYHNQVINNQLNRMFTYGVKLYNGHSRINSITDNILYDVNYGITLSYMIDSKNRIMDNFIGDNSNPGVYAQQDAATTSQMNSYGIGTFNVTDHNSHDYNLQIATNHIILDNINTTTGQYAADGIRIEKTNSPKFQVASNDVTLNLATCDINNPSYGIRLLGSDGGDVECNHIVNNLGTTQTNNEESYGIHNQDSHGTNILHNSTEYMASGISTAYTSYGVQLTCNEIDNSYTGALFISVVNLPNQGSSAYGTGNVFSGTSASPAYDVDVFAGIHVSPAVIWYDLILPYMPIFTSTDITGTPASATSCPSSGAGILACGGGGGGENAELLSEQRERLLGKIIRGENTYDTLSEQFLMRDSIYAFKKLFMLDTLMHLGDDDDSLYKNYYDYCKGRNIGQFEDVNQHIIDSVFGHIVSARITNENIETRGTIQDNEKLVNEIYLKMLYYESDTTRKEGTYYVFDDADVETLVSVAYQHPALGGDAVYLARILLWIDVNDDRNVTLRNKAVFKLKPNKSTYVIYPNPNNGTFIVEYKMEGTENALMNIYDITGRLVKKYKLDANGNHGTIDAGQLDAGTYYYEIIEKDKQVKADKLVIVK